MNKNVKIAKELVRLAKSLMASNEFEPHEYQLIHKNPDGKTASNELVKIVRQAKASWMKNFTIDDSDENRVKASFYVGTEVMQYSWEFEVTRRSDGIFKYMVEGNCIYTGKHGFDDAKKLRELIKFGIDHMMFG